MYEQTGQQEMVDQLLKAMTKKFKASAMVFWNRYVVYFHFFISEYCDFVFFLKIFGWCVEWWAIYSSLDSVYGTEP